jgi:hypothetical protein
MSNENYGALRALAIFHFTLAGLLAAAIAFGVGIVLMDPSSRDSSHGNRVLPFVIFLTSLMVPLLFSFCIGLSAWSLWRARNRKLICAVALLECLCFPVGTILGVATFIVLQTKNSTEIFNAHSPIPPPVPGAERQEWDY